MKKGLLKVFIGVIVIMTFGWLGSLFFGRYLTPILINNKFFSELSIFDNDKKNTTIINKTEKVIVGEDRSINEISSSATYAVVEVMSFSKKSGEKFSKNLTTQTQGGYLDGKSGAGMILTNDGVIVTSRNNILEEDSDYKVATFSGATLDAKVIGIDEFTDLAFLKVEGSNLTTIPFADSDNVSSGRRVIVMGNHSGSQKIFLTEGVLSAVDDNFSLSGGEVSSSEKMEGVFRVDFNANDDFVGGPVINYEGELLAINAVINKGPEKIFYQVPINIVRDSMQKVVESRLDKTAKLGVYYISINSYYKNLKNLPVDKGALIYSSSGKQGLAIVASSVADRAGFKIGDIITSVDGNEINSSNSLSDLVSQYEQGNSASFGVIRGEEKMEINVDF